MSFSAAIDYACVVAIHRAARIAAHSMPERSSGKHCRRGSRIAEHDRRYTGNTFPNGFRRTVWISGARGSERIIVVLRFGMTTAVLDQHSFSVAESPSLSTTLTTAAWHRRRRRTGMGLQRSTCQISRGQPLYYHCQQTIRKEFSRSTISFHSL